MTAHNAAFAGPFTLSTSTTSNSSFISANTSSSAPLRPLFPNRSLCSRSTRALNRSIIGMTISPPSPTATNPTDSIPGTTQISFRKYHGLGNDFILIDNRESTKPILTAAQSQRLCDRHEGIGGDGVIFLLPSKKTETEQPSDFQMRIYNSDGSEPEMCGNGIRCLAKFAYDLNISSNDNEYKIDTLAGLIIAKFDKQTQQVCVDMGEPITEPNSKIPTLLANQGDTLTIDDKDYEMYTVSMGNPHAITFISDRQEYEKIDLNLDSIGPKFENHQVFPQKTNTEFVFMRNEMDYDMIVWERGAGRTQACGTGACAVVVACIMTDKSRYDTPITIHLPGGDLIIEWRSQSNHILMTGPAQLVFDGTLSI